MSKSDSSLESFQQSSKKFVHFSISKRRSLRDFYTLGTHSADHIKQMKNALEKKRIKPAKLTDRDIEESILIFNPPNWKWQKTKANDLDLNIERILWHSKSPWHIFTVDTPPKHCEPVAGDGNCLFRAFSFWITGTEDAHFAVREHIIREFVHNSSLYLSLTSHPNVESYMRETSMHHEGVWGTEVEIFVAATLLNTPIAVFAAFGDRALWQLFKPLEKPSGQNNNRIAPRHHPGHQSEPTTMLYLHNSSNHFEPVVDI